MSKRAILPTVRHPREGIVPPRSISGVLPPPSSPRTRGPRGTTTQPVHQRGKQAHPSSANASSPHAPSPARPPRHPRERGDPEERQRIRIHPLTEPRMNSSSQQLRVQIPPSGVPLLNEIKLPFPIPALDGFLPLDRSLYGLVTLVPHQNVRSVPLRQAFEFPILVTPNPLNQVRRHPRVKSPISPTCDDINVSRTHPPNLRTLRPKMPSACQLPLPQAPATTHPSSSTASTPPFRVISALPLQSPSAPSFPRTREPRGPKKHPFPCASPHPMPTSKYPTFGAECPDGRRVGLAATPGIYSNHKPLAQTHIVFKNTPTLVPNQNPPDPLPSRSSGPFRTSMS